MHEIAQFVRPSIAVCCVMTLRIRMIVSLSVLAVIVSVGWTKVAVSGLCFDQRPYIPSAVMYHI